MEGRISRQFYRVQFCHLIHARSRITAESWTRTFISKLLHITHSQWIFRNFMLHGQTHGLLRMREKEAILLHIEELSLSNKNDLPEESRFLLEFDLGRLRRADYEMQCYWTAAVSAAREAIHGPTVNEPRSNPRDDRRSISRHRRGQQTNPTRIDPPGNLKVPSPRPFPAIRYAMEDSNRARKPD